MAELCAKECKECPFRRASAPGFLGSSSGDPWDFAAQHVYGDVYLPCHLRVNWEKSDAQERALEAPVCRGFMTMMKNAGQMPRNPEMAALYSQMPPDPETFFASYKEFHEHHSNPELARSMRNT